MGPLKGVSMVSCEGRRSARQAPWRQLDECTTPAATGRTEWQAAALGAGTGRLFSPFLEAFFPLYGTQQRSVEVSSVSNSE
jgi:hypothetical protein